MRKRSRLAGQLACWMIVVAGTGCGRAILGPALSPVDDAAVHHSTDGGAWIEPDGRVRAPDKAGLAARLRPRAAPVRVGWAAMRLRADATPTLGVKAAPAAARGSRQPTGARPCVSPAKSCAAPFAPSRCRTRLTAADVAMRARPARSAAAAAA